MYITKEVKEDLKLLIKENIEYWKSYIPEPCECELDECECNLNCLTIGLNNEGDQWNYQTGDNSFTGGAYGCPHWAVVWFGKETTKEELIEELLEDIDNIETYED